MSFQQEVVNFQDSGPKITSQTEFKTIFNAQQRCVQQSRVGSFLRDHFLSQNAEKGADAVILLKSGETIKIHLVLFAAHSEFFHKKFLNDEKEIDGTKYDPESVKKVVEFTYTTRLNYKLVNVPELLQVGRDFGLENFVHVLEDQLVKASFRLTILIHCLNIATATRACVSSSTKAVILNNCCNNFYVILEDPRFIQLSPNAIKALLNLEKLPLNGEMDVGRTLIYYLSAPENQKYAMNLISVIRHEFLNPQQKAFLIHEASKINLGMKQIFDQYLNHIPHLKMSRNPRRASSFHKQMFRRVMQGLTGGQDSFASSFRSDGGGSENPYYKEYSFGEALNSCRDSIEERSRVPDCFANESVKIQPVHDENPYARVYTSDWLAKISRNPLHLSESLHELGKLPDLFKEKVVDMGQRAVDYAANLVGITPTTPEKQPNKSASTISGHDSLYDLQRIPDCFKTSTPKSCRTQSPVIDRPNTPISAIRSYGSNGDRPTEGVTTAKSFGSITARQAKSPIFNREYGQNNAVTPPGFQFDPYGQISIVPVIGTPKPPPPFINYADSTASNDSINPMTSETIAEINDHPNYFDPNTSHPGITFERVVAPSSSQQSNLFTARSPGSTGSTQRKF